MNYRRLSDPNFGRLLGGVHTDTSVSVAASFYGERPCPLEVYDHGNPAHQERMRMALQKLAQVQGSTSVVYMGVGGYEIDRSSSRDSLKNGKLSLGHFDSDGSVRPKLEVSIQDFFDENPSMAKLTKFKYGYQLREPAQWTSWDKLQSWSDNTEDPAGGDFDLPASIRRNVGCDAVPLIGWKLLTSAGIHRNRWEREEIVLVHASSGQTIEVAAETVIANIPKGLDRNARLLSSVVRMKASHDGPWINDRYVLGRYEWEKDQFALENQLTAGDVVWVDRKDLVKWNPELIDPIEIDHQKKTKELRGKVDAFVERFGYLPLPRQCWAAKSGLRSWFREPAANGSAYRVVVNNEAAQRLLRLRLPDLAKLADNLSTPMAQVRYYPVFVRSENAQGTDPGQRQKTWFIEDFNRTTEFHLRPDSLRDDIGNDLSMSTNANNAGSLRISHSALLRDNPAFLPMILKQRPDFIERSSDPELIPTLKQIKIDHPDLLQGIDLDRIEAGKPMRYNPNRTLIHQNMLPSNVALGVYLGSDKKQISSFAFSNFEGVPLSTGDQIQYAGVLDGYRGIDAELGNTEVTTQHIADLINRYFLECSGRYADPKQLLADAITHAHRAIIDQQPIPTKRSDISGSYIVIDTHNKTIHYARIGDARYTLKIGATPIPSSDLIVEAPNTPIIGRSDCPFEITVDSHRFGDEPLDILLSTVGASAQLDRRSDAFGPFDTPQTLIQRVAKHISSFTGPRGLQPKHSDFALLAISLGHQGWAYREGENGGLDEAALNGYANPGERFVIGRARNCAIQISNNAQFSREQCALIKHNSVWRIEHLSATNATQIYQPSGSNRWQKIAILETRGLLAPIAVGDKIKVGDTEFIFTGEGRKATPKAVQPDPLPEIQAEELAPAEPLPAPRPPVVHRITHPAPTSKAFPVTGAPLLIGGWRALPFKYMLGDSEKWIAFERADRKPTDPVSLRFFGKINDADEFEVGGSTERPARTKVPAGHYASVGNKLPPSTFKLRFTHSGTGCLISAVHGIQQLHTDGRAIGEDWVPLHSGTTVYYNDQPILIEFPELI